MRIFASLSLLLILSGNTPATPGHALFPEPHPVEGKLELVATLVNLPAREALPLLWGDAEELHAGITKCFPY